MTDQVTDTHNPTPAAEPLALRLSEGLGPNATLLDRLRSTAHWCLTEGNGDDATHQALTEAIAEVERLRQQNLDVAFAILRNDRAEAVQWAKGLLLNEDREVCEAHGIGGLTPEFMQAQADEAPRLDLGA